MLSLPSDISVPLSVCVGVLLNGGVVCCVLSPVFMLSPSSLRCSRLVLSYPPCVVLSPLCCSVLLCCVLWMGKCGGTCHE